jgi:membrane protease YdiL (CAAX protease family)
MNETRPSTDSQSPTPSADNTQPEPLIRRIPPVLFAFLSLVVVFFLYQVVFGTFTYLLGGEKITGDNVTFIRVATLVGQLFFLLLPTMLLARARKGSLTGYFNIRIPEYKEVILSVVAVFSLQVLLQGYLTLQDSWPSIYPQEVQKYLDELKRMIDGMYRGLVSAHSPAEFGFVVLVVAIVPAVSEEILFRGLVQQSMAEQFGGRSAAIITGVIFAMFHVNPFAIVPLIVLGMYFGFLVLRSGNIAISISAHLFNNFVACAAVYMGVDESMLIAPGGEVTPEVAFVNYLGFVVVFLLSTYYFVRITRQDVKNET